MGVERLGDGDGKMAVISADVEDLALSEDGGWKGVKAEERPFIVIMMVVSVSGSHILLYPNILIIF